MKRHTSTVMLAALGLSLWQGCTSNEDDDPGFVPSTTSGTTTDGSGGTANNSSGTTDGSSSVTSGSSTTGNDTSSTTGSSGGTGGGGMTVEEACPELVEECGTSNLQSQSKQINILIVLDKSGSMDKVAGGERKWDAMRDALSTALNSPSAQNIEFGLSLYPFPDVGNEPIDLDNCGQAGNCCEMPSGSDPQVGIGEGTDQVTTVLDATEPGGGTPTAVALERARDYFTNGPGSNLSGEKYVMLATDGGPNCNAGLTCGADVCTANLDGADCSAAPDGNCCDESYAGDGAQCLDDSNVVDEIEALGNAGIDTFVVGIPGSEEYSSYLDEFAEAGGRAVTGSDYSYYRVDDVNDLADTFEEITVQLVTSCEFQFDDAPATQPKIAIDCNIVDRFGSGGGEAGAGNSGDTENWTWDGQTGTVILQGDTCDMVSEGVNRVDVLFACPDIG